MPKLGPVPPSPEPVDPFKKQGPPPLGVVESTQVTAVPERAPKLGVVRDRGGQVVSVAPPPPEQIGVVAPVLSPSAPALVPPPPAVGTVQDETPVYPPPLPPARPALGTIVDLAITPILPSEELVEAPLPLVSRPVVVDPLAPKE